MSNRRRRTNGLAKSAVMQPKYRSKVETDKSKYNKSERKFTKEALKKGLYFFSLLGITVVTNSTGFNHDKSKRGSRRGTH